MRTHLCANNLPLKAAAGCDVTWTVDIIPSVVDDDMKFYKLYNIFFQYSFSVFSYRQCS